MLARGVSWLVAAPLIAVLPDVARACGPAALLHGPEALVAEVHQRLAHQGVAETAPQGCPAVRVRLRAERRQIAVSIDDGYGHLVERDVSSVEAASALIESWSSSPSGDLRADVPLAPIREEEPPVLAAPVKRQRYHLLAEGESSLDTNGYAWLGARAAACFTVGPLCLGGVLRLARDQPLPGLGARSTLTRTDWEGLVTVAWPLWLRRVTLWPSLGVGLGWMHVSDRSDANEANLDDDRVPRVELALGVSAPLGAGLALVGLVALDASLIAVTYAENGDPVQPRGFGRLALGLAWRGF